MSASVPMRWAAGILFWVTFAVVVLAQFAIVAPEFWLTRLWEDEAFNLTVPQNLLAGHGYSSAGLLGSGTLTPFDVRISTGPVVLLPVATVLSTGIDPVVGGRLISMLFYVGLLIALWLLGSRIAGRWGALIAVIVPLALNTNQLPSPVQGPVDILGEFPAAALVAWSIVASRRRPWLAGLFLGLAIQTKFISLLAAPALLVYLWFLFADESWRARLKRCAWFAAWAAGPTVLYWLVVLVCLGPGGFVSNAHQFLAFLRTGGQTASVPPEQKLTALTNSWFVESWVATLVIVSTVVIGALGVLAVHFRVASGASGDQSVQDAGARTSARDIVFLLFAAGINLVAWAGWWTLSRGTPAWIRYPATGLVVSIPMLAAAAVLGVRLVWMLGTTTTRERALRSIFMCVAALACAAIVASVGVGVERHVVAVEFPDYGETLSQQRDVARQLAATRDQKFATPWGSQIGAILMSRVPFTSMTRPGADRLPTVLWTPELSDPGQAAFDALISSVCKRDVVRIAAQYAVCRVG